MAKTPMMQQYDDAKTACGDAVLLFRMGDFYELFFEDAKLVARVLGLTLTSRDKGENPIPMAGFPHHQLDGYLAKLIAAGYRCAVCEQMEDPKLAKGLVKREVTRIVSPGTVTDDVLLDPKEANYLLAVCEDSGRSASGRLGMAWADLSTGRFLATTMEPERLADQVARIAPSEILLVESSSVAETLRARGLDTSRGRRLMLTTRPAWSFGLDEATRSLESHFQLRGLGGLGFDDDESVAIRACGGLLAYLLETQKHSLSHLDHPLPWRRSRTLEIDEATRRSLEITRTLRESRREGSLLSVLDRCVTPMGSRLLGDWLANPSTDRERIESRLDAVDLAVTQGDWSEAVRGRLQEIYDVPRLLARIVAGRATPRDLSFVSRTLGSLPAIGELLQQAQTPWLGELSAKFDTAQDVREVLEAALEEECPIQPRDGGFIRAGYSSELDELREMAHGGKRWIAGYQSKIIEETGITNLKVGFNKVFGYYIEATQSQSTKIPPNFIRKQTIKNAERYITPELKEYEERVLTADERAKTLEYELFCDLRQRVHDATSRLQVTAEVLASLDVITALGDLARRRGYCRPEIVDEPVLEIQDGRHPVLDITEAEGTFVPNDVVMGGETGIVMLITGPNMAGKSTYIRQVALLTLMAQIGSFIPARSARIGLADRIFARVGASDELSRGQSTFMVEMTETARILNTATSRSLVVLDEIGRGTSTYDGVSLAWAIVEHLHDQIGCRTLFATHYHELTDLKQTLSGVRNLNVAVKEWDDQVVFLHKIVPGAADKSYGIHVARLAGVPRSVNERAKQILAQLEDEHLDAEGKPKISSSSGKKRTQRGQKGDLQLTLFGYADHPLLDRIRETDVNQITPIEALRLIAEWHQRLESGG